jgi:GWxTD domain-containing protein
MLIDGSEATKARDLLERVVGERPQWPVAWYGLGVARLQVARTGGLARSGALHPVGVSNEAGAGYALVRALELDSTFVQAAEALASASLPREGASRIAERLAMLNRVEGLLSPAARYQAGIVAITANDGASAVRFLAPIQGTRSAVNGLAALALARAHYQSGNPIAGRAALIAGAGDSNPASRAAYRKELAWVAEPEELAAWDSLPHTTSSQWLADFWARRDVRDARPDGARLIEHYARLEYAFEVFQRIVPQVGHQKNAGMSEAMDYFVEDAELLKHPVLLNDTYMSGVFSPFRAFRTTQTLIDDRGVIWIRHGKPDKRAHTVDGRAYEAWRYDRPEGSLVVQFREENFDGQAGASVLVPSLVTASPLQRDQLCAIEHSLCSMNADPRGGLAVMGSGMGDYNPPWSQNPSKDRIALDAKINTTARINRLRLEGLDAITRATTTDDYARPFTKAFGPTVQIYGLDRASGGAGRAVIAFAIPGDQLDHTLPPEAGGRAVYTVRIEVMLSRRSDGRRFDLDTLRRFATAAPLAGGKYITGLVEVPLPPGRYVATVVLSQGELGSIARLGELTVPNPRNVLSVSDLVFGREGSGLRWQSGATAVPLHPLNSYPRGGEVEVYYQLAGLRQGVSYANRVELYGADDDVNKSPRLSIGFETTASDARVEVSRTLGLKSLEPGRYRIRLTVRGGEESVSAIAWLTVVK